MNTPREGSIGIPERADTSPSPENGAGADGTAEANRARHKRARKTTLGMSSPPHSSSQTPGESENRDSNETLDKRLLLHALIAVRDGDFSARLPSDWTGIYGKIADTFNEIVLANQTMEHELERVSEVVGKQGKIRQRVGFITRGGAWRDMEESVNSLISDLVWPISEVTRSIACVAKGGFDADDPS